jgi:hypothetical protein
MSNVLSEGKKQQVIALGRLGWPLRRIEQETGVRRETAGAYLKAAGIGVRPPRMWGRRPPAKPANEETTGSDATKPANTNTNTNTEDLSTRGKAKAETAKPANENEVTTGFGVELSDSRPKDPKRALSTSFCEPFRDAIELSLSRDRNAAPVTAAEELLEIVMRRYERTSTLLTSNRPVEDWGKLLGDSAAVTAMLDRLLHHGHVLKFGPRSWRTKIDLPPQEAAG